MDLCVCGHEEREHVEMCGCGVEIEIEPDTFAMSCACTHYRRSPLSAFRGPSVTMSREEAAGRLDAMALFTSARVAERGTVDEIEARANWCEAQALAPKLTTKRTWEEAARILRAVRA